MAFVTEEFPPQLPKSAPTLQERAWPEEDPLWSDAETTAAHHEIAEAIELVQRIRALGHSHRVPRGTRDRIRVAVRAADGQGTSKHIARLIGGLVPATVVDGHGR